MRAYCNRVSWLARHNLYSDVQQSLYKACETLRFCQFASPFYFILFHTSFSFYFLNISGFLFWRTPLPLTTASTKFCWTVFLFFYLPLAHCLKLYLFVHVELVESTMSDTQAKDKLTVLCYATHLLSCWLVRLLLA